LNNEYITTKQAAEKWNISDRRVRTLCNEGRIIGTKKEGKSYKIPLNAEKPIDGRKLSIEKIRLLKWENVTIGRIDNDNIVTFIQPEYNEVVSIYTHGVLTWSAAQFSEFLSERIVSRERRDIERILFQSGLSYYDVFRIAEITRGIHPKDLLWIAHTKNEIYNEVITDVFESIFKQRIDSVGESIDTPEGYNIKRYGVYNGQYGIYKRRISPLTSDVESEIAVSFLAKKLGVPCCPAYWIDKDTVFSAFQYDFSSEYIIHFRRLFTDKRSENEYENLVSIRPSYIDDIRRMILLDFITRQDDRHLSNIAIKISSQEETFYPLYDNGRSLFYEDTKELVEQAVKNIENYATSFGYSGSYWDYVQEIIKEKGSVKDLINLDISDEEIADILRIAKFKDYRFDGALLWITSTLEMIRNISE